MAFFSRPGAAVTLDNLVERVFRPELVGQDPLQREWLWHRVWELDRIEELPLPTLGLVDIALWDLAGRLAGLPTWRVLGGYRTAIPAYASTSTFASDRGVPRRGRPVPGARLPGHQAARLG